MLHFSKSDEETNSSIPWTAWRWFWVNYSFESRSEWAVILLRSEEAKLCLFTTGDQRPKLATSPKETLYHLTKLTLIFITERQEGACEGANRTGHKRNNRERKGRILFQDSREHKRWNEKMAVKSRGHGHLWRRWVGWSQKTNMKPGKGENWWIFQRLPDPTPAEIRHSAPKITALPNGTSSQADWGSRVYSGHLRIHRSENVQPTRTRTRASDLIGQLFRWALADSLSEFIVLNLEKTHRDHKYWGENLQAPHDPFPFNSGNRNPISIILLFSLIIIIN